MKTKISTIARIWGKQKLLNVYFFVCRHASIFFAVSKVKVRTIYVTVVCFTFCNYVKLFIKQLKFV